MGYNKTFFVGLYMSLLAVTSCHPHYSLTPTDYTIIPYYGNETLIYKSNYNNFDTFFLDRYEKEVNTRTYNSKEILCDRYIIKYDADKKFKKVGINAIANYFCFLEATESGKFLNIYTFWHSPIFLTTIKIDSLIALPGDKMKVEKKDLNDIIELENFRINDTIKYKNTAITKAYWSKSKGLIGYDLVSGEKWRLERIQ